MLSDSCHQELRGKAPAESLVTLSSGYSGYRRGLNEWTYCHKYQHKMLLQFLPRAFQIEHRRPATQQKAKVAGFSFSFRSLTHCNPITFSTNWNAFIPSRGSNLGSHIGSLGSPLRWSFSPHLLPLLAMPFTALSHYLAAYLTSHPPAAFCHIDIWTLASCKMHQFLKG